MNEHYRYYKNSYVSTFNRTKLISFTFQFQMGKIASLVDLPKGNDKAMFVTAQRLGTLEKDFPWLELKHVTEIIIRKYKMAKIWRSHSHELRIRWQKHNLNCI